MYNNFKFNVTLPCYPRYMGKILPQHDYFPINVHTNISLLRLYLIQQEETNSFELDT